MIITWEAGFPDMGPYIQFLIYGQHPHVTIEVLPCYTLRAPPPKQVTQNYNYTQILGLVNFRPDRPLGG